MGLLQVSPRRALLGGLRNAPASVLASVPWIAQWRFNADGNDAIGTNHVTNNNSATFTTGILGGATGATQLVAASSQYWSIANNSVLQTGNVDFSLLAWVYLDSKPANTMSIVCKGNTSSEYELQWTTADRFKFIVYHGTGFAVNAQVVANLFGAPSLSTWYMLYAYFDSVNGIAGISVNNGTANTSAKTATPVTGANIMAVGTDIGFGGHYWNGRVDNVCMAKGTGAVLTAAQVTAVYNAGVGTEAITAATRYREAVRRWSLDWLRSPRKTALSWISERQAELTQFKLRGALEVG